MRTTDKLIWKVLKANINISQTVGYVAALFAGLTIIMIASALYADVARISGGKSGRPLFPDRFQVISKESDNSPFTALTSPPGFSAEEIAGIASQPFVKRCAQFDASRFDASIAADFGGVRFSTAIFFEAVPDDFFDTLPESWGFNPACPVIPIILPADYLTIYNFGYAPSRGLPKISQGVLKRIPLRVVISGRDRIEAFPARVAGFTDRLNTIAVPLEFLVWANDRFGESESVPVRLIAETKGGSEAEAERYFEAEGFKVSNGNGDSGRVSGLIRGASIIIAIIGCALCLLALIIATLSLGLLISKNREAIIGLRLIGFSIKEISIGYRRMMVCANLAAYFLATAAVAVIHILWRASLADAGLDSAPIVTPLLVGLAFTVAITLLCWHSIHKAMK